MEPCLFPKLDYALNVHPARTEILTFSLYDRLSNRRSKLDVLQHAISPLKYHEILWALVLRIYTSNETVAFGTQSDSVDCGSCPRSGPICSVSLSPSQTIPSIRISYTTVPNLVGDVSCDAIPLPNTNVFFTSDRRIIRDYKKSSQANGAMRQHKDIDLSDCSNAQDLVQSSQARRNGLKLVFTDYLGILTLKIRFETCAYSKEAIVNVGNTCRTVFQSLLENPNQTVAGIWSLSTLDVDQIFRWNSGTRPSVQSTVHDEISRHVKRRPDAPALHSWDGNLTYDQLDLVSGNVASYLCDVGMRSGELVPVYFEKSKWAVVAMLGVLKGGITWGAFVPLDPSNASERTKSIITSINARFVLTSPTYSGAFEDAGVNVVVAEKVSHYRGSTQNKTPPVVLPQSPAFVLFTSGTTGQPKGVVQEHAAVCTISKAYGDTLYVNQDSRVLQFASYAFDVSMVDIFNTLIHGGCVCIPSEFQRKNEIVSVINDMQVTWADLTPSFSNTFLPEDVPCLRTLVLAGEEVKKEQVERWAKSVQLINCYGPSECGGCTAYEYPNCESSADTIGFPLPCFKLWVVNEDDVNRLVSIGAVGELLVEGPTLARGYLNDESRTREAFIENPAWLPANADKTPRRLYRTKDLVQYRTDGSLRFVGRSDTQVKIRGQRVELGEIEYQLTQFYGLAKSIVAFPKIGKYANQLVAVVETRGEDTSCASDAAKAILKRRLPQYMVPSVWLAVDEIPLSPSIKVDRRQVDQLLASIDANDSRIAIRAASAQDQCPILPPANMLADEIGRQIVEQLSTRNSNSYTSLIGHDFRPAAVGFDSIAAITLRMWLKKRYNADVPVSQLTSDAVTISGLANLINRPQNGASSVELLQDVENMFCDVIARLTKFALGSVKPSGNAKVVFLTGATGYLGREILHQLLVNPTIDKVFILVRCQNQSAVHSRIPEIAGNVMLQQPEKLEIWPGDLQLKQLGLAHHHWQTLISDVDVIVHNGAVVRWNVDYETLRRANVVSTLEILKATADSLLSKLFVYVSGGQQLMPGEDDDAAILNQVSSTSGYAQTKFASELLIKRVGGSELASRHTFSIIKPSYIIGSPADGIANTTDYLWRLVASAIEIGSYPSSSSSDDGLEQAIVYLSDIETVASKTVGAAMEPLLHGNGARVAKILDRITLEEFWGCVREAGYALDPVHELQWWEDMKGYVLGSGERHALWPLMWMLENQHGFWSTAPESSTNDGHCTDRVKKAIQSNLRWLRREKILPGF